MHYIVLKIYHTKNKKIFIDIEINTSNSPVFVSYFFIKVITDPITPKKPAIIINIYSTGNLFASNIAVIKLSETMYSLSLIHIYIVLEDICENKDKSFLVVLNTVKSSKNIYKYLKENTDRDIMYLSTEIYPKLRLEKINKIKNSYKKYVVVSTQLIEAGVDRCV